MTKAKANAPETPLFQPGNRLTYQHGPEGRRVWSIQIKAPKGARRVRVLLHSGSEEVPVKKGWATLPLPYATRTVDHLAEGPTLFTETRSLLAGALLLHEVEIRAEAGLEKELAGVLRPESDDQFPPEVRKALNHLADRLESHGATSVALLKAAAPRALPELTLYPGVLADNALALRKDWQEQLELLSDGQRRFAEPASSKTVAVLEREARTTVQPEYWDLSTPEWRLLHAVFALYTSGGKSGNSYTHEYVQEDWPLLLAAAGVPERKERSKRGDFNQKRRRDLQEAMEGLAVTKNRPGSGRRVPVYISLRDRDGTWSVAADDVPILERIPIWDGLSDEEHETRLRSSPKTWPEPDRYKLRLPRALRVGLESYFLQIPTDLWTRLEEGSAEVVGQNRGVQARDYALALWLYNHRPQVRSGDLVQFVQRDDLVDMIPALRRAKEARQAGRVRKSIEQSYQIMQEAGLLISYRLAVPTAGGLRDKLVLARELFQGHCRLLPKAEPTRAAG
jgi:hypothetical protein